MSDSDTIFIGYVILYCVAMSKSDTMARDVCRKTVCRLFITSTPCPISRQTYTHQCLKLAHDLKNSYQA